MCETMKKAYAGSVDFLNECRNALGANTPTSESSQIAEVLHLTKVFRSMTPCREDVTAFLKAMREDSSPAFTAVQKRQLTEVATTCITNAPAHDVIADGTHGSKKEQTHLTSYDYYTDDIWQYITSDKPLRKKMNTVSKEWIRWGLRFPSGPTYRIGLSTILAASDTTASGHQAHSMFEEFKTEHKKLRDVYTGAPTLKTFPVAAADFQLMYADMWKEPHVPVPCRIDVGLIKELASPKTIACRVHVVGKASKHGTDAEGSNTSQVKRTPRETMLEGLLCLALQPGIAQDGAGSVGSLMNLTSPAPRPRTRMPRKTAREPAPEELLTLEDAAESEKDDAGVAASGCATPGVLDKRASLVAEFLKNKKTAKDNEEDEEDDSDADAAKEGKPVKQTLVRKRPASSIAGGAIGVIALPKGEGARVIYRGATVYRRKHTIKIHIARKHSRSGKECDVQLVDNGTNEPLMKAMRYVDARV